jgi:hypothetical protein
VDDFNRIVSAVAREYGDQLVLSALTAYVDLPSETIAHYALTLLMDRVAKS